MRIDLINLSLPSGWKRNVLTLADGREVPLLSATHPAEPLRVSHGLTGRIRVTFSLHRPPGKFCELEMKSERDGHWRHVRPVHFIDDDAGGVQEAVVGPLLADGTDLIIKPVDRLASVCELVEIEIAPAGEPIAWRKRNVGAVCDSHGMFAKGGVESAADIEATLDPFVESDFDRICWGVGAGSFRMLYFSDVLPYFGEGKRSFYNEPNAKVAATMAALKRSGVDPIDVGVDFCHRNGMEFWAGDRICHCWAPGGFDDDFAAPFYLENQHLRTVFPDGSIGATLSLAHREFQDLKIALYAELAERGVDGIYIDLMRKPNVIGADEPIVAEFERRVGRRPETSDFASMEWLTIRAEFATEYMRRVRARLNEISTQQGRKIKIAAQGFSGCLSTGSAVPEENLSQGYDIETWAREGLIDVFAPSTTRHHRPISLLRYANMLADADCALWGCLGQHHNALFPANYDHAVYCGDDPDKWITPIADLDPMRVMRNAADCYAQGAEGVFLWEAGEIAHCPARWNLLRELGHKKKWIDLFTPGIGPMDGRGHFELQ